MLHPSARICGKDGRCYPSLETLGRSLGVSERQARDYVKELERAALIAIEQRGLRKTNVYLFVWTIELEQLLNSRPVAGEGNGPEFLDDPGREMGLSDRNGCSAPVRKSRSVPGPEQWFRSLRNRLTWNEYRGILIFFGYYGTG